MVESKAYSSVGALIGATVGGIVGLVLAMKYQFGTDNLYILPLNCGIIGGFIVGKFLDIIRSIEGQSTKYEWNYALLSGIFGISVGMFAIFARSFEIILSQVISFGMLSAFIGCIVSELKQCETSVRIILIDSIKESLLMGILTIPAMIIASLAWVVMWFLILAIWLIIVITSIVIWIFINIANALIADIDWPLNDVANIEISNVFLNVVDFSSMHIITTPIFVIPILLFIGGLIGSSFGSLFDTTSDEINQTNILKRTSNNQKKYKTIPLEDTIKTTVALCDSSKILLSQANKLFNQKKYTDALEKYERSLNKFTEANVNRNKFQDDDLVYSISENISTLKTNITTCKSAIGTEITSEALDKFDDEDFNEAIRLYKSSLKYIDDDDLISKVKSNIERCYVGIDAKKVEELSVHATSLLKNATNLNEPFKAREILKEADKHIEDAILLSTKRDFTDAFEQLRIIAKDIQNQRDIVYDQFSNEKVVIGKYDIATIEGKTPSIVTPTDKSNNRVGVVREYEFYNGFIRMKLSVKNNTVHTITDVSIDVDINNDILRLDHYEPDTYHLKKEKLQLGNIAPDDDRTIVLYLDPLICTKGTKIKCRIDYENTYGKSKSLRMEHLKIPIVCPIFQTDQDINIGRLKELILSLVHGSKIIALPKNVNLDDAMTLCREVIQMHDMHHVRTFKTTDDAVAETWYYGKTKVEKNDIVVKASINKDNILLRMHNLELLCKKTG